MTTTGRFTFVRHPFSKVASAYTYRIIKTEKNSNGVVLGKKKICFIIKCSTLRKLMKLLQRLDLAICTPCVRPISLLNRLNNTAGCVSGNGTTF